MKIFLSWSGEKSKQIADALKDWLPNVIQNANTWFSKHDIDAGSRWSNELQKELENTDFGIICLTKSNCYSPWLLFEAGALSKKLEQSHVCPYLIDLEPSEIPSGPLSQFQAVSANKDETITLIKTINKVLNENAINESRLVKTFEKWWPDLENSLINLTQDHENKQSSRTLEDMIKEILLILRGMSRSTDFYLHPGKKFSYSERIKNIIDKDKAVDGGKSKA